MLVLRAMEILFAVLFAIGIITQVIMPLLQGRLIFPILRRSGDLIDELAQARQRKRDAELEMEIKSENEAAAKIHKEAVGEPVNTEEKTQ